MSSADHRDALLDVLGSLNVASKQWVIRQYDHEVQGGSVVKPLVGPQCDGPGDAAVIRPRIESRRGLVISCGMNPHYGDFDTYHMAASAIDEAIRNASPSAPIRVESRSWTTSVGATPIEPKRSARWFARRLPVTTWRSPWEHRSSAARTA